MARNRYIKSKSNYVLKSFHQSANIGDIAERDFMTIAELNSYAPGSLPAYGLNGFKMVVDDGVNLKKRHQYGTWLKNEACGKPTNYWSGKCLDEDDETISMASSSEVVLKPNYTSILDFAYFGSARKLVESSVSNIIRHYPGEIFLLDTYITTPSGTRLYEVDNPFGIDFDSLYFQDEEVEEPLRVFSLSYEKYIAIAEDGMMGNITEWTKNSTKEGICSADGALLSVISLGTPVGQNKHLTLYYYNIGGEKMLFHDGTFTGMSVRPNTKTINKYFKGLDDFQKLLLNKKTNYTAILDTPMETERGNVTYKKSYTWPKTGLGEWNLDVSSMAYRTYLSSLLNIADFYDNYYTDNIWGAMTHEAIITFDWTLTKISQDGTEELTDPNSSRVKAFLHVAGRNFDDLKKYVDGISYANSVTYSEADNNPDCFLSDSLTNYGWDVRTPIPANIGKYMTLSLYPGHVEGYTSQDANFEFYRRLLINSGAILRAKGTKRSVEMMLSLFGYQSVNFVEHSFHDVLRDGEYVTVHWDDLDEDERNDVMKTAYDINEFVYVAGEGSTAYGSAATEVTKFVNSQKMTYDVSDSDELQGLPVREVISVVKEPIKAGLGWDGNQIITDVVVGYKDVDVHYMIPWFDRDKEHDSDIYFESKGGWGLTMTKTTTVPEYGDVYIETSDDLKIYDEGVKYLKFQEDIEGLLNIVGEYPKVGDVYYVYDITEQDRYDWGLLGNEAQPTMSHYFILKDIDNDDVFGVLRDESGNVMIEEDTGKASAEQPEGAQTPNINWEILPEKKYGWKNISEEELKQGTSRDAQKVFYLESIIENGLGNAPHSGKGEYDDGEEYMLFFGDIFKGAKDNEEFEYVDDRYLPWTSSYNGELIEVDGNNNIGFNLDKKIDNVKCWYFTDLSIAHDLQTLRMTNEGEYVAIGNVVPTVGDEETSMRYYKDFRDFNGIETDDPELFSSRQYDMMEPYNMEGGSTDDEAAANSIINTKALYIEFFPDLTHDSLYEFIDDVAMHYAKQIIPSTTIFKYKVPMTGFDVFCSNRTFLQSALVSAE